MSLEKIVSALLPRDRCDQVLGDLQERGFLVRDVVSTLPLVWWSHATRISRLALGSDADVTARTGELKLGGRLITAFLMSCLGAVGQLPWLFFGVLWFLLQYWADSVRTPSLLANGRIEFLARYRGELDRQIDNSKWNVVLVLVSLLLPPVRASVVPLTALIIAGVLVALRFARLRREVRTLENPISLA